MKPSRRAIELVDRVPWEQLDTESEFLSQAFYERPTIQVARDLLGKVLVHRKTSGMIVETEAYLGKEDRAAHAFRGLTPRTKVLYGPPGRAYVYLIYGIYECLNLVAETEGTPGCVLIRALEPLTGLKSMQRRRPKARCVEELTSGPGKLTAALGISRRHNGDDLTSGPLTVRRWPWMTSFKIQVTPRIGIRHCADWPLRFLIEGSRWVKRG